MTDPNDMPVWTGQARAYAIAHLAGAAEQLSEVVINTAQRLMDEGIDPNKAINPDGTPVMAPMLCAYVNALTVLAQQAPNG